MKKYLFSTITLTLFFLVINPALCQKAKVKFGKISDDELLMKKYKNDTSAEAIILHDIGEVNFKYTNESYFNVEFNRKVRIKILKKEGYEHARFEILLGKQNNGDYKIHKLKGASFELDENNKIIKTKLEKRDIFDEEINKYWKQTKFEIPNVKVGSIIEVEYTINANSWRIPTWEFQKDIPVVRSEYKVIIPEYFKYKKLHKGYFPINSSEISYKQNNFTYKIKDKVPDIGGKVNVYEGTIDYRENLQLFFADNIPAFKSENYITCSKNYKSAINFELASFKPPYGIQKNYTQSWEDISKGLFKNEDFGDQLKHGFFFNEAKTNILSTCNTPEEKVSAAVKFIKKRINWNKINGKYAYHGIRKAYNEGNGNCADVNLALVCLLNKIGLDASPVILSTRENGFIHPGQIMSEQFNYVIASVKISNQHTLIDATEKNLPIGTLPERCLNEKGRLIDENGGYWVELNPNSKSIKSYQLDLTVNENNIEGRTIEKYNGYAALDKRNDLLFHNTDEDYIKKIQENRNEIKITLDSIRNKNNIDKPIEFYCQITSEELVEKAGNLLMISPIIFSRVTNNPFKLEKREYPVDYSYPKLTNYIATISIPEGYSVENLPKPKKVLMPEKGASFLLSMQQADDKIIVVSKLSINKITFLPEEYEYLKQFYNQIIDAHAQQIILKKI